MSVLISGVPYIGFRLLEKRLIWTARLKSSNVTLERTDLFNYAA